MFFLAILLQRISKVNNSSCFFTSFCIYYVTCCLRTHSLYPLLMFQIQTSLKTDSNFALFKHYQFNQCTIHWLFYTSAFTLESNSGPMNEQMNNLLFFHWNVDSSLAQNLSKISQIEACNSLHSHDFICISETYFDSTILWGDRGFQLNRYNLIKADHPSNTKQRGVCIYYRVSESLSKL